MIHTAKIGFEFEFFTELNKADLIDKLQFILKKRIRIPVKRMGLHVNYPVYHTNLKPTTSLFKIEPDYSGGKNMYELITGVLDYEEAIVVYKRMCYFIEKYGYTTDKSAFQINISFSDIDVHKLNVLKFVLNFNEAKIYNVYPNRKNSVYAKSIKRIYPRNIYTFGYNDYNFILPNEKNYGVNFTKLKDGYLEYRYMGGKDYEKKVDKTIGLITYCINNLYKIINKPSLTDNDRNKISKILDRYDGIKESFNYYKVFEEKYPEIRFTVDLQNYLRVINVFWNSVRNELFKIIIRNDINKAWINYDTEIGKLQIYNTEIANGNYLEGIDIIKSNIFNTKISNVELINSNLHTCIVSNSNMIKSNKILDCKLLNNNIYSSNYLKNCYIDNTVENITSGIFDNCIIRRGEISWLSIVKGKTELLNTKNTFDTYTTIDKK